MLTLPKIFDRAQQPYVAIGATVPMGAIEDIAPKLFNEIWSWVDKRNLAPAGGAILKYNVIDMAGDLELEFGVPLLNAGESDGRVISGMLPAGRYAAVTWHGGYDALYDVNAVLIGWARNVASAGMSKKPQPATNSAAGWRSTRAIPRRYPIRLTGRPK